MTADTSKKTVSIRLSGIMNSYCKIFPSTPVDSFSQDFRKFKGGVVFVKFLYFLVFSSELYDCDYCFQVFGLGFFNQIGRSFSLYPHVFGVVSPISAGDSISRFRLEMPSGRVHDFVQRDDCFSLRVCSRCLSSRVFYVCLKKNARNILIVLIVFAYSRKEV